MEWKDGNNQPIDTSEFSGKIQIRENVNKTAVVELTDGNGITISDSGEITLSISPSKTALLTQPKYVYDFILTDASLNKTKLLYGDVIVSRAVTV